jgi:histidinol-phosphate aminotransferase/imidazoleglycerol-phosphate dehydratase/histidinol-phosphatase
MTWLDNITRPEIRTLIPYSSARNEHAADDHSIRLDANESPFPPYTHTHNDEKLNRYPEPQPAALKQKLAELYCVTSEQLLITRGADEGIDLLIRCFCAPGKDSILYTPPTFSAYHIFAQINHTKAIASPLDADNNFLPDMTDLFAKSTPEAHIIFLCSPNNPTASIVPLSFIDELCEKNTEKRLIVVDEAYIEFGEDLPSASTLLNKHQHLVILRTLSKAYGLAGARIGAVIAHPEIIQTLRKILSPYPISTGSAKKALEALSPVGLSYANRQIREILSEKARVLSLLKKSPHIEHIFPSKTNFLLIKVKDPNELYSQLKQQGVIVRNISKVVPGALRITIGKKEENNILIQLITKELLEFTSKERTATKTRKTNETAITTHLSLDPDKPKIDIDTGIPFFDHMLEQLAKHSGITLEMKAIGDTHIDAHHTVEDVAIVLGQALKEALGDKHGIGRYGFVLPMDEACTQAAIDLSGRGALVFEATFETSHAGDFPTEMLKHFFWTLAMNMEAAIHIHISGENAHHMIESSFKAFAKSLKQAIAQTGTGIPSTKGVL